MLCFPTSHIYCFCITLQNRKARRQCTGAWCVQQSPTAAVLSTSFLLNHAPLVPILNALITRHRESYSSVSMSRESKRLKKSSSCMVELRQCTNTAFRAVATGVYLYIYIYPPKSVPGYYFVH